MQVQRKNTFILYFHFKTIYISDWYPELTCLVQGFKRSNIREVFSSCLTQPAIVTRKLKTSGQI